MSDCRRERGGIGHSAARGEGCDRHGAAWDWLTDLGQGAWLLALSVLVAGTVVVPVIVGHGATSTCDQAVHQLNEVRLYDGNTSLMPRAPQELHRAATQLDKFAGQSTGAQRQALRALAEDARSARGNQPFHVKSQLAALHDACF